MRATLAIARKELSVHVTTPWAWVVFTLMLSLTGFFFVSLLQTFVEMQALSRSVGGWGPLEQLRPGAGVYRNLTDGVVVQLWGAVSIVTLFVAPLLSMRLLAEERQSGTLELLMTTPLRPVELVLGKYLGGLGIMGATLGLTLLFPLALSLLGEAGGGAVLEWPTVLLGHFGLLLWGAACVAIGLFLSALTRSQMIAALLTFSVLLPWMLLRGLAQGAPEPWRSVVGHLAFDAQLEPLFAGVFELKTPLFFASIIALSLLLTHRALEAQRQAAS